MGYKEVREVKFPLWLVTLLKNLFQLDISKLDNKLHERGRGGIKLNTKFCGTHHSAFSGSMLTTSAKPASAPSGSVSTIPFLQWKGREKNDRLVKHIKYKADTNNTALPA